MLERFKRFLSAISEIDRYWHKIAGDEMARYGLKGPHATYLVAIRRHPEGLTAGQLGECCGRDKADVSRTMATLEKKGLVVKEEVGASLYRGVYRLTEEGLAAAGHVCQRASLAVELAGKDLTEESRAAFYAALESIVANLRKLSEEGLPQ